MHFYDAWMDSEELKGRAQTLYELNEPLVDQLLRQPPAFWLFALLVVFFPGVGNHLAQAVSSV